MYTCSGISFEFIEGRILNNSLRRDRPDTIRCIVASLIGDSESGDSLVDDSEPIVPLYQPLDEDFMDQSWEPDPYDAGPGICLADRFYFLPLIHFTNRLPSE
jgi:hypothetical protein